MSVFTARQWIAVAVGFFLFLGLFFINRNPPTTLQASNSGGHAAPAGGEDFMQVLKTSEESVDPAAQHVIDRQLNLLNHASDSLQGRVLYRISFIYDSIGQPLAATYYMEELAQLKQSSDNIWYKTGERYLDLADFIESPGKPALLTRAENCFNTILKNDSNNLDARVGLGSCIVELGENPMAGIMMITGVVNKDSNNESAQIALGRFSITSGQYAKAVRRFNRALQIDTSFKEGYLYLAQSYEGLGNFKQAVAYLEKYRTFAPDSAVKSRIDKNIEEDLHHQN